MKIIQGHLHIFRTENSSHFHAHSFPFFFSELSPFSFFFSIFNSSQLYFVFNELYIPVRVPLDVENTCLNNKQNDHFFQVTKVSKTNSLLNIWEVSRGR